MPRKFSPTQRVIMDVTLVFTVVVIAMVALASLVVSMPHVVFAVAIGGLSVIAVDGVYARMMTRPDHLRAMQSHQILEIANESLAYLRQGLDSESAGAVCRYALRETEAAAVAITDTEKVLGFAGVGEDHHSVGGADHHAGDAGGARAQRAPHPRDRGGDRLSRKGLPAARRRSSCRSRCAACPSGR